MAVKFTDWCEGEISLRDYQAHGVMLRGVWPAGQAPMPTEHDPVQRAQDINSSRAATWRHAGMP